jgi:hypothetical protein
VLTLDQLGISEENWNQMPPAGRAAIMFLLCNSSGGKNCNKIKVCDSNQDQESKDRLKCNPKTQ